MSTISAGTTSTTAFKVTSDTTGSLLLKTGASGVTAVDIDASQVVTIGNIAVTGGTINNTIIGGTTAVAGSFTTLTAASTVTLNGGTANGVAYLNGSKNLTTGSALVFDGTNLGIGTASPGAKLDVNGAGIVRGFLTTTDAIKLGGNTSAPASTDSFIYRPADNTLAFGTASAERARINSSGNFGINSTSPYSKLQVNGAVTMGSSDSDGRPALTSTYWGYSNSYRTLLIGSASTSYATNNTGAVTVAFNYDPVVNANGAFNGDGREIIFRRGTQFVTPNAANTAFNLTNLVLIDGDVGIGTASPGSILHIQKGNGSIRLDNGDGNYSIWQQTGSDTRFGTQSAIPLVFYTNANERARITSGGNFGIGTSSPNGKLQVENSTPNSGVPTIYSNANYGNTGDTSTGLRVNLNNGAGGLYISGYSGEAILAYNNEYIAGSGWVARSTTASQITQNSGSIIFSTNTGLTAGNVFTPTERARITSGGNFQVSNGQVIVSAGSGDSYSARLSCAYNFPTIDTYLDSYAGASYSGQIMFRTNSGGGAMTERARITSGGDFLVGGTSALQSAKITAYGSVAAQNGGVDGTFANAFVGVYSANSNEHNAIQTAVSSGGTLSGFRFRASLGGGSSTTYPVLDLTRDQTIFYTANTERARIASNGQFTVSSSLAGSNLLSFTNSSATGYGISMSVNNDSSGTYRYFEGYSSSASAQRIAIYTNGDVKNTNGVFAAFSDAKLKKDIVDAGSQWSDIKALRVRKYKLKDDAEGIVQIGLIAQEVEQVSPGLVNESQDETRDEEGKIVLTGEVTKGVKYSILYMKAVKALQEAMARIESLESRLAALETK